jgi:hypothetical protein
MSYARRDHGLDFQLRQPPYGPHDLAHVQGERWVGPFRGIPPPSARLLPPRLTASVS